MIIFCALLVFSSVFSATQLFAQTSIQNAQTYAYQSGDILFQDLDCGPLCVAIETVTQGAGGKSFSHLGMVYFRNDTGFVIEAIGKEVQLTPLQAFVYRSTDEQGNPKIVVAKLKPQYAQLNQKALQFALAQLGVPYDDAFLYDNGRYYCSELVYDAYKAANQNLPFFQLFPMTFKDPATNQTFPAWQSYYEQLNTPIPEGELGCNPGGISTSDKLQIVASFYP